MSAVGIIGLITIAAFYGSYFIKMFTQSKNGIKTDRMGRGSKPKKTFVIEIILKASTFLTAGIQLISIVFIKNIPIVMQNNLLRYIGIVIAILGVTIFITAIVTMHDSWRAGIDSTQKTEIINTGIYRYSRNPAFVGFDFLYVGIGLAFSNIINIIFACLSILLLHLQILEEEKYLPTVFGKAYLAYKEKTGRYFGAGTGGRS
jgi:protein-S-isoprenylcysteine O-methyltransferase Ste14